MKLLLALMLVSLGALAHDLPNPKLTPGMFNPAVTQYNIDKNICIPNWTATVRPPVSYTNKLKIKQIAQYGYKDVNPADYEEDHLIPLSLGGSPTDPRNLWPEPWHSVWNAHVKDRLEVLLHKKVCDHSLTLQEAQAMIVANWIAAYKYLIPQAIPNGSPQ